MNKTLWVTSILSWVTSILWACLYYLSEDQNKNLKSKLCKYEIEYCTKEELLTKINGSEDE